MPKKISANMRTAGNLFITMRSMYILPCLLLITLFAGCKKGGADDATGGGNNAPLTKYKGTITLTRLGQSTDAAGVQHVYYEKLELTGVVLNNIITGYWLNSTGTKIATKAEIHDMHYLPEKVDPINWSKTYFTYTENTLSQSETVVSLSPAEESVTGLQPLFGFQLAVTGYNVPNVEEEVTDKDGTVTKYGTYPIPGQVVDLNIPANYGRITGTQTETVDGIPWTMTWDFIGQ